MEEEEEEEEEEHEEQVREGYDQEPTYFEGIKKSQLHVIIVRALCRFDCNQQCP